MIHRALYDVAFSADWGRQMRFITGPRQCGKTTLAEAKLKAEGTPSSYYLWDLRDVRERYKKNQLFFTEDHAPLTSKKKWVCFDEIHKISGWKNALKAIFDSTNAHYQFIVTGSAKLNVLKKAGDSLAGRYFTFQLYPLGVWELAGRQTEAIRAPKTARDYLVERMDSRGAGDATLAALLDYSGFPEPFLSESKAFYSTWSRDYMDTVVKEDIGALTQIVHKEHLHDVYRLLPEMVGSPLSESSIASHVQLSNPTVKNHLRRLEDFFLVFKVHPYSKNIKRALLKAPKCYLFDWARVESPGHRFENFVAAQWTARLRLWQEKSGDEYSLFYVRNKQKQETDFLTLKNKRPWLLIETKLSDASIENHHFDFQKQLGDIPVVQVCRQPGVAGLQTKDGFRLSADRFLS